MINNKFKPLDRTKKEILKTAMGSASSTTIDLNKVRDEWKYGDYIRSERHKEIIHTNDMPVKLIYKMDIEMNIKGDVAGNLFINSFGKIYGCVEGDIYFLTDEQLEGFEIKIIVIGE